MKTIDGKIHVGDWFENSDAVLIDDRGPIAKELDWLCGKKVSIRYWITNERITKPAAQEIFLKKLFGEADICYESHYSEYTGYLWTDEDLNIGGHDLLNELRSSDGKYLILEVEAHDE